MDGQRRKGICEVGSKEVSRRTREVRGLCSPGWLVKVVVFSIGYGLRP
jgi:hypothetical protein